MVSVIKFFFVLTSIRGITCFAQDAENSVTPQVEEVGEFLSKADNWQWPLSADTESSELHMFNVLASWCGDTYADAIADAKSKSDQFAKLREERDSRYKEWMQCTVEKATQEQDLQRECVKQQLVHNSSFVREKSMMQAEFDRQYAHMQADVEACELRLKRRVEATCDRDARMAQASCLEEISALNADLAACQGQVAAVDSERCAELALGALTADEDRRAWEAERDRLAAEVAECRPGKAQAEARLSGVLADGTIASLESTVAWLQGLLSACLLLLAAASAAAAGLYLTLQRSPWPTTAAEGGMASLASWHPLSQPPGKLRLLSGEQAREALQEEYESGQSGGRRRTGQGVEVILTTTAEGEGGSPLVFLLLPVNVCSSRRFALFGEGGDYRGHVERAQEFVSGVSPKSKLVLVLYEFGGCLFTESTLQNLRLTADRVADEVVPKDSKFPTRKDVVVLWLFSADGLCAANSEGESELTAAIKAQPWAQYLLERSGRWGKLPML